MTQPPLTLAIETSTPVGSVSLGHADQVLAEVVLGPAARHSEQLLPAVDFLFRSTSTSRDQLRRVIVGSGPGSFTGLRIAAATAKGLASAMDLEFFAYSGLLAVAAGTGVQGPVCALFDARRDEVYAACYRLQTGMETVLSARADRIGSVLQQPGVGDWVFAGEGAQKHEPLIRAAGAAVLPGHLGIPRASALLWLGWQVPEAGRVADPPHWEPNYLRAAGAERGIRG